LATKTGKAVRLEPGDEAVIRADIVLLSRIDSPVSRFALHLEEIFDTGIQGPVVVGVLPEDSIKMLGLAAKEAYRLTPSEWRFPKLHKIGDAFRKIVQKRRRRTSRLQKGESATVRADLTSVAVSKSSDEGRIMLTFTEKDGGVAFVRVPDRSLSPLAASLLQSIRLARTIPTTVSPPYVSTLSDEIILDQLQVVESASRSRRALRFWVGGVPICVSAPVEAWQTILGDLLQSNPSDK
jgi:hypothetical protein